MARQIDFTPLQEAANEFSWDSILAIAPSLAGVLKQLIRDGATPDEISDALKEYTGWPDMPRTVELAARHLRGRPQ